MAAHQRTQCGFPLVRLALAAALVTAVGCSRAPEDPDRHSPNPRIRILLTRSTEPVLALPSGDTIHMSDEMKAFYKARFYRAAWTSRKGVLPRGQALVTALNEADEEGLDPADYHLKSIPVLVEQAKSDLEQDLPVGDGLGNLDLLLTESFLRYATDIRRGTIDPSGEGLDWEVPQEDDTNTRFLIDLFKDDDLEKALAALRPDVPFYDGLRAGLARYREVEAAGGWPSVDEGKPLKEGDKGPRVTQIRARLLAEGDPVEVPLVQGAAAPDVYDERLAEAVVHFQDRQGLADDGAAGEGTIRAMNVPVEERVKSIRLNLDRWRWLPREFGDHYIMVNVAGFEMVVMKDDKKAIGMRVVVGKTGNQTPIFRDTLENIVVNPYWNVPATIAKEEIFPAMARDPDYLARNNMELVSNGKGVRQKPGPKNALGEVKFLFPNSHDVYLHDTPADALFSRASRAFSHGCIRLERPRDLAYYLFENAAGKTRADYDELVGGAEKWISVTEKLPVYVLYFTAWPDDDGSVHFYQDIYNRDDGVVETVTEQIAQADARATPERTAMAR